MKRPTVKHCGNTKDFDDLSPRDQETVERLKAYIARNHELQQTAKTEDEKLRASVEAYEDVFGEPPFEMKKGTI